MIVKLTKYYTRRGHRSSNHRSNSGRLISSTACPKMFSHVVLAEPPQFFTPSSTEAPPLTDVLAGKPHHLHLGGVQPPLLVVDVEPAEEVTVKAHLGKQARLPDTRRAVTRSIYAHAQLPPLGWGWLDRPVEQASGPGVSSPLTWKAG